MSAQQKPQAGLQAVLNHPVVRQVQQTVNVQLAGLDKELSKYKVANDLEARTNVPKAISFIGLFGVFVTLIFFNLFGLAQPISTLVGYVLPAYLSVKALESPSENDDKQWLTYWVSFSTLTLVESLFLRLVMYYIPFYFVFKTTFLIWLQLPATRGAEILYHQVIFPFVIRNGRSRNFASGYQPTSTANIHRTE
ncbi:Protein involved in membrane traffic (YOP1/TB2/DP1/HVA22 family) [Phaffia rhodozyma]|uniref:Protein YOP1 n=1 Tax=Phaffia rhodozyma TaxID=264483 RepID=A0A0F7SNJ8_PHARH|nr:Protein involved in membrane traffic (YOP1/TB2/DP1/HVA22 family) [Phaffia rhodozyma]